MLMRNNESSSSKNKRISIIIATRNEGINLRRTLERLLKNTYYPDFEILILNDASQDASCDFLTQPPYVHHKKIRLIHYQSRQGLQTLWQEGVKQATGSVLQFLDAHVSVSPYWLTNLYRRLERHNFQALVAPVSSTLDSISWKFTTRQNFGYTWNATLQNYRSLNYNEIWRNCRVPWVNLGRMMLTRKLWDEIAGLLPIYTNRRIQEQDFCLRAYRAGYDCYIEPTAMIGHYKKPQTVNNLVSYTEQREQIIDYFCLIYMSFDEQKREQIISQYKNKHIDEYQTFLNKQPELEKLRIQFRKKQRRSLDKLLSELQVENKTPWHTNNGKLARKTPPLVSIIITAVNEGKYVQQTVDSILKKTEYPSYEIILVDDASCDDSFTFLKEEPYISNPMIRYEHFNYSAGMIRARYHGAEISQGEYILIMDAHMSVPSGWLTGMMAAHHRWGPNSVIAPHLADISKEDWSIKEWQDRILHSFLMMDEKFDFAQKDYPYSIGLTPTFSGGCVLISRSFYNEIGGIDEGLRHWGCENIDLSFKIYSGGGTVFYEPSVVIGHLWKREIKRNVGFGFDFAYNKLRTGYMHLPTAAFNRLFKNLKTNDQWFQEGLRQFEYDMPELQYYRQKQNHRRKYDLECYLRMFFPGLAGNVKRKRSISLKIKKDLAAKKSTHKNAVAVKV